MAKLKTPEAVEAWDKVMQFAPEADYDPEYVAFRKVVDKLVRAVQDETELALMRGECGHLGEKHMLLTNLYSSLSLCHRSVQRETAYQQIKAALDKYLGIDFPRKKHKRSRRKLLIPD